LLQHFWKTTLVSNDVDDMGWSACHFAASGGQIDVLALLLAHRPNLDLQDAFDCTPLAISFTTTFTDNWRVSLMLIEAGSSLDFGRVRRHLCDFAVTSTSSIQALVNRGVVIRDLRRPGDSRTPLHVAAERSRDVEVLNMLIELCDLEARDSFLCTCAHIAAWFGNSDALRCVIAAGANVTSANVDGGTPLHVARASACTVLLLAAGADVNASDRCDSTALRTALIDNNFDVAWVVHALLAAGADMEGASVRRLLADRRVVVRADNVERARRDIATVQLDFVRHRALQVCIGLQSRRLDALQMCEILLFACGPLSRLIAFHQWWKIATTVKHFRQH
jgi:hypothetical protein